MPYLQDQGPDLKEEHVQTQAALSRLQAGIDRLNEKLLRLARSHFPDHWTELTPCLFKVYSWVGYDIDGRVDIDWGEALCLRLQEKRDQLASYLKVIQNIRKNNSFNKDAISALEALTERFDHAFQSTRHDLELFTSDLSNPPNLVAAANHLTRDSKRRLRSTKSLYPLIRRAIEGAKTDKARLKLLMLRAKLRGFGLGTARIHFRLNSRHVMTAIRPELNVAKGQIHDERTLARRIARKIRNTKPMTVNFASLALEKNTARRQMILIAQMHKYIDNETPVRMLIAECEDSIVPLGMLYLAHSYGLENHIDISPLFETSNALNTAGRMLTKLLYHKTYKEYVCRRGIFAVQTGFSDAGRFMGQLPATLAIERLQSHLASVLDEHGLGDVTAIIFNTHGESMGRGGHPGTLKDRLAYVMSPWAMQQFEKRDIDFCHETSFQGGDGFLWFQTGDLTHASLLTLLSARYEDRTSAQTDIFYQQRDFSWDIYRTLSAEQERLYENADYASILSLFAQNLLIPTGSRAVKRSGGPNRADPRTLRAIPHNAILQQFGIPANIFFGLGRASQIDPERFLELYENSDRARRVIGLALSALRRSDISILTAYACLFDPGFWLGRALSGREPKLNIFFQAIAEILQHNRLRIQIVDLANVLRLNQLQCESAFPLSLVMPDNALRILSALRIAVLMKMQTLAAGLPQFAGDGIRNLDVLQRLQEHDVDQIVIDLKAQYPAIGANTDWTRDLTEKTQNPVSSSQGFPHLIETIIKPLERLALLTRQTSIAITHHYDAFG